MTSSDRVAEDGTLKPPTPKDTTSTCGKTDRAMPEMDHLEFLHAEHHRGTFVPTLDSCEQHTREQYEKDYGYLVTEQEAKRGVQPGVGFVQTMRHHDEQLRQALNESRLPMMGGMGFAFQAPTINQPEVEFKSPPFVHALVDVAINRRLALDFKGMPVPEDVSRRLEEAFGPFSPARPTAPSEPEPDQINRAKFPPNDTDKLRVALNNVLMGRPDRAVKIVKGFSVEDCRTFVEALCELEAVLIARVSVEFIDEMLQVEP